MGKILALDYGRKMLGIAISDESHTFAFERTCIENRSSQGMLKELQKHIEHDNIEQIVIGLPLNAEGKESEMSLEVRLFGNMLEESFHLPLAFVDERLSSVQNQKIQTFFQSAKKKREKARKYKHSGEAKLILEKYIEKSEKKFDNKNK